MAEANQVARAPLARALGPADNEAYYQKWLASDGFYKKLFVSGVNYDVLTGDFADDLVPTMAYLAWYGRHRVVRPNKAVNKIACLVGSWADLFGPYISQAYICEQDEARQLLRGAVRELLTRDLDQVSNATRATFLRGGNNEDPARGEMWDHVAAGAGARYNVESATTILHHLAEQSLPAFRIGGVSMIVHVYISILKRGTMTEAFTDKISEGMSNDLGIQNLQLASEACRMFYGTFGSMVNDTNIGAITDHWTRMLPVNALRLSLTVMKACNSGITALIVIGRAVKIFDDFDWARIVQIFQQEWTSVEVAMNDVGNNKWYGFRHNLGRVASTKYKNVAYVAKELLIKVNGEASLRSYGGWTRRAKYQAVLDTMIADYEAAKTESVLRGVEIPAVLQHELIIRLRHLIDNAGEKLQIQQVYIRLVYL